MNNEMCALYLVEDTASGDVKIGISYNPRERKKEIEQRKCKLIEQRNAARKRLKLNEMKKIIFIMSRCLIICGVFPIK